MKILVTTNAVPFVRGGAEELAEHLVHHLNARKGIQAELLRIPFRWDPAERLIEEMLISRTLKLYNVDRVIGMKFPAYLIPHDNKMLWLMHQYRQAYDLYREGLTNIPLGPAGEPLLRAIRAADNTCFADAKRIFTISPVVKDRLARFNQTPAEVLHHPLNDPERFGGGSYGGYIFAGGRVGNGKRQHLLVEAMSHVRADLKLIVAGPLESPAYGEELQALARKLGVEDKVEFRFGFRPRDEIIGLVNEALACAAAPIDEDSISYVAMEAFAAGKCVVTTTDAGGLLEIVKDDATGFVTEPTAQALGRALETLGADRPRALRLGAASRDAWDRLDISWGSRIDRLLS
jgi:glycosyltransferase involved in cell wall biosynthesis